MIAMNRLAVESMVARMRSASTRGMTVVAREPRPRRDQGTLFAQLLLGRCERVIAGNRHRKLLLDLEITIEGLCPVTHEKAALRVVDELLSNSLEHGFRGLGRGQVAVHVTRCAGAGVQIGISDDGHGFDVATVADGNGFRLLRQLGHLRLNGARGPLTGAAVTVGIPAPPLDWRAPGRQVAAATLECKP